MFTRLFGGVGNVPPPTTDYSELESVLDSVLTSSDARDSSFALREACTTDPDLLVGFAMALLKREDAFENLVMAKEKEDAAQVVLELVALSCERAGKSLVKSKRLVEILMVGVRNEGSVWVRVSSAQALEALILAAPDDTLESLLAVPSALEDIVGLLNDERPEVRNETIVLLHRLTDFSEQFRMFMMFCDGFTLLLKIAEEENESIMAGDCLAVCVNALRANPIGQKQFFETQGFLDSLAQLLIFDPNTIEAGSAASLRVGKCISLVRMLCCGRSEAPGLIELTRPTLIELESFGSSQEMRDKRAQSLKLAQSKLGATKDMLKNLYAVATSSMSLFEDEMRQEALRAIGDLTCRHAKNATAFERMHAFSFLVKYVLTSSRWIDVQAAVYAWMCALEFGSEEGEQRAIALLGHAVAPPPEAEDALENTDIPSAGDDAVRFIASTMMASLKSVHSLRDEVYVDVGRVSECRVVMWKATKLFESLLNSSSACDLATRLSFVGDGSEYPKPTVFQSLIDALKLLSEERDDTDAVRALVSDSRASILRLLVIWISKSSASVRLLLASSVNLFLFDPTIWKIQRNEGALQSSCLSALLAASCLVATWGDYERGKSKEKPIAFGLIENRHQGGFSTFLGRLKKLKNLPGYGKPAQGFTWGSDACALLVFDLEFKRLCERVIDESDLVIVKSSSVGNGVAVVLQPKVEVVQRLSESKASIDGRNTSSSTAGVGLPRSVTFEEPKPIEAASEKSAILERRLKTLEEEHAKVLLVLAHQEVERQSLLQTIEDLGGPKELDKALTRSAKLLAAAFQESDRHN